MNDVPRGRDLASLFGRLSLDNVAGVTSSILSSRLYSCVPFQ